MITESAAHRWVSRDTLAWMLAAQGVSILPLFFYLPLWIPLLWAGAMVWRIQIYRGAWSFPSNRVKMALGLVSIAALLLSYMGSLGVEPLVAFLLVSFVLKLIEVRSRSDVLLVINVGFITVATQFLFSQSVLMSIYGVASILMLLAAWNCLYRSKSLTIGRQFSVSVLLLVQSLPIMLVLFLVLPRVGTLWHVPMPKGSGVTGFSDSMSPGDFSELGKSQEVAFRVSFDENSALPPRRDWYWRGLVLDYFDGRTWHNRSSALNSRLSSNGRYPREWGLEVDAEASFFRYTVLLEPHQQPWLFTLMAPVAAQSNSLPMYFSNDYLTKATRPVASRSQYDVVSSSQYRAHPEPLSAYSLRMLLAIPKSSNPQTRALGERWRASGLTDQQIIDSSLERYRASFVYTMQPPALGQHSVDEFLFTTQRGFCEHFASSFVFLMRAAGIPARVVVGYQGGELNPGEGYVIVRQAEAHAWAEVWLEGQGWLRVDPTAAVSPLRIEQGLEQSLDVSERQFARSMFSGNFFNYWQLRLDAFSYSWHKWVLAYDNHAQASIFKRLLGGNSALHIGIFFVAVLATILILYFLVFTWRGKIHFRYPEQRIYHRVLKRLAKIGYIPTAEETPVAFAKRVATERPDLASQLNEFAQLYTRVAYQNDSKALLVLKARAHHYRFK